LRWKSLYTSRPNLAGKQSCEGYKEGMLQYGNKFAPKILMLFPVKYA
jgi:hypothetical protein